MDDFMAGVMSTGQQLGDIGKEINESFIAIMLHLLTAHYDPLVMVLQNSNIKITIDVVKAKLINEASKRSGLKKGLCSPTDPRNLVKLNLNPNEPRN
jgi:hypothetical protein